MEWYQYVACFFAGAFLLNAVPHLVHGISGDKFPTPFAKPPGKGLSSPMVNVLWAFFNIVVGGLLCRAGLIGRPQPLTLFLAFCGALAISIMSANNFQKKDKE